MVKLIYRHKYVISILWFYHTPHGEHVIFIYNNTSIRPCLIISVVNKY